MGWGGGGGAGGGGVGGGGGGGDELCYLSCPVYYYLVNSVILNYLCVWNNIRGEI